MQIMDEFSSREHLPHKSPHNPDRKQAMAHSTVQSITCEDGFNRLAFPVDNEVIERSYSTWAFAVMLVLKQDHELIFCQFLSIG